MESSLKKRMDDLGIAEEDIYEKFILGTGSGGQKINKTSSCVYIKHLPTGLEFKCQAERSREMNRRRVREWLCDTLESMQHEQNQRVKAEKAKKRRQNRRPSKGEKEKLFQSKKKHSAKKANRRISQD